MKRAVGVVEKTIRYKLESNFNPTFMDIRNESYMHNVPQGSETHFNITLVSSAFNNIPLIQRHRMIYTLLKEETDKGVHALSLQTKTPNEWEQNSLLNKSPKCLGGFNS